MQKCRIKFTVITLHLEQQSNVKNTAKNCKIYYSYSTVLCTYLSCVPYLQHVLTINRIFNPSLRWPATIPHSNSIFCIDVWDWSQIFLWKWLSLPDSEQKFWDKLRQEMYFSSILIILVGNICFLSPLVLSKWEDLAFSVCIKVCLIFNFWMLKCTIMANKTQLWILSLKNWKKHNFLKKYKN